MNASQLSLVFAALAASPAAFAECGLHKRVLDEPIVGVQTQLYPWREQARGYLGRYPNQPLLVNPDLPEDKNRDGIGEFPGWGSFHSQADYDITLREAKDSAIDAMAFFADRPRRFFTAAADSKVGGIGVLPILTFWKEGVTNDFREIETALANPRALRVGGKMLLPSYWMALRNTPERLKEKFDAVRAKYGDQFLFIVSVPAISAKWGTYERQGRKLTPADERFIADQARAYARVGDGI